MTTGQGISAFWALILTGKPEVYTKLASVGAQTLSSEKSVARLESKVVHRVNMSGTEETFSSPISSPYPHSGDNDDVPMSKPIKPSKAGAKRRWSHLISDDDDDEYEDQSFKQQDADAPPLSTRFMKGQSKKRDSPPAKRSRQTRQAAIPPQMAGNEIYDPPDKPEFDGTEELEQLWPWAQEPCPIMMVSDLTKPFPGPLENGLRQRALFRTSAWVDSEEEDEPMEGEKNSWLLLEKEMEQLPHEVSEEVPKTPQRYGPQTRFLSVPPIGLHEDSSPGNDDIRVEKKTIMEEITVRRNANIPVQKPTVRAKPNARKANTSTASQATAAVSVLIPSLLSKMPEFRLYLEISSKELPSYSVRTTSGPLNL
ncbi:hypothetical protein PTI98_008303 [Pleurotus ostreatus]|nr:hypothetical protein PTI98_008303 [Pleurotus ostreatus]